MCVELLLAVIIAMVAVAYVRSIAGPAIDTVVLSVALIIRSNTRVVLVFSTNSTTKFSTKISS